MDTNFKGLKPAFIDNYTAIAMSSSDEYLPYLSVCLQSLVDNASDKHNYDIVIFSSTEMSYRKKIFLETYTAKNISIRFYNPRKFLQNVKMEVTHNNFHEVCYYRLAAPIVFRQYKKLIFTDIDLIFNCDLKMLSDINLGNSTIAACVEPIWKYFKDNNLPLNGGISIEDYSKNVLKLKEIEKYYNTGVTVINVEKFNSNNCFEKLQDAINAHSFIFQEQCALNYVFQEDIYQLDGQWNVETFLNMKNIYDKDKTKIIHYPGLEKPWFYPEMELANIWWSYARKTPFYEEIMKRMTISGIALPPPPEKACHISDYALYWKYKILQNFVTGETKNRYFRKKHLYKDKIKAKR